MKHTMVCSTWIKEHDEIVLEILQKADRMPTVEELMEMTGLRRFQIEGTLRLWRQAVRMAQARRRMPEGSNLLPENWREELLEESADEDALVSEIDWGDCRPGR